VNEPAYIELEARLNNLAVARQFVREQCEIQGISDRSLVDGLMLAVDEAMTNVIVHGYQKGPGSIELVVGREGYKLVVWLRDQAPVFDPTTVPPPDLAIPVIERALGGMGIHLIRQSVDEIGHFPLPGGGNELRLIKYLNG
jgi:serine/threonine-protein kinase RsbW